MLGNITSLAIVSFLSLGSFANGFVSPPVRPHITSPLPLTSPIPTATPTPTPLPTAPPTPTSIPTPTPTITPTPTPMPILTSESLEELFSHYSSQYSVDKELLKRIAFCESGFRADASYLDYLGIFQFSASSWQTTRSSMNADTNPDLRSNAEEAIKTAAFKISQPNGQHAWPNCQ